jgi:hypothetical protein
MAEAIDKRLNQNVLLAKIDLLPIILPFLFVFLSTIKCTTHNADQRTDQ